MVYELKKARDRCKMSIRHTDKARNGWTLCSNMSSYFSYKWLIFNFKYFNILYFIILIFNIYM